MKPLSQLREIQAQTFLLHFTTVRAALLNAEWLHTNGATAFGTRPSLIPRNPDDLLGHIRQNNNSTNSNADDPAQGGIRFAAHQCESDATEQKANA